MWRFVALAVLVLAVEVPTAWYLEDIEGTLAAGDVACPEAPPFPAPRIELRPQANGTLAVAMIAPAEFDAWLYGAFATTESWRVRWDGRLAPLPVREVVREFAPDYAGVQVPAGEARVVDHVAVEFEAPLVVRHHVDGMCAIVRI